jgi:AcrR family transcriptional regulator
LSYQVKKPQQNRGIITKKHIVETAIKLFSQKGFYNTSSNEISKQSGVSVGCFYSYFKDKKQLFLEALDYYDELIEKGMEAEFNIDLNNKGKTIFDLINGILQAHKIFPEFHQEIAAMSILDKDVKEYMFKQDNAIIKHISNMLWHFKNDIKVVNVDAASVILYNAVEKTVHTLLFGGSGIEEGLLIKELANMILKYLF